MWNKVRFHVPGISTSEENWTAERSVSHNALQSFNDLFMEFLKVKGCVFYISQFNQWFVLVLGVLRLTCWTMKDACAIRLLCVPSLVNWI